MINRPKTPIAIICIILLSFSYWSYLSQNTSMQISADAADYEELGSLIKHNGFIPAYFEHGPRREPLYPLLISLSMHLSSWFHTSYLSIMALFGIIILLSCQIFLYRILSTLGINQPIIGLTLLYFGLSPAILNTAFSLYSEIITLPLVLMIILCSAKCSLAFANRNKLKTVLWGNLLGFIFALTTLGKGAFEVIFILCSISVLILSLIHFFKKKYLETTLLILFLCSSNLCFYIPISTYKSLNAAYNGNFNITNRFPWMFYGSSKRRIEPLTKEKILTALAYTPGEGLCNSLFPPTDCMFWSFQTTDGYGMQRLHELSDEHLKIKTINKILLNESITHIRQHPLQYSLLQGLEGLRMFFWESTQIGFVTYPRWLKKIYDIRLLNNTLRFLVALLSLVSVFWLWITALQKITPAIMRWVALLIFTFIFTFSFVSILTRYALPIAPLFLISIAYFINFMYNKFYAKNQQHS